MLPDTKERVWKNDQEQVDSQSSSIKKFLQCIQQQRQRRQCDDRGYLYLKACPYGSKYLKMYARNLWQKIISQNKAQRNFECTQKRIG